MRPPILPLLATLALAVAAGPAPAQSVCHGAAFAAERQAGLPEGLLDAIGQVESGRPDPASHQLWAWPWTVNAAGQGRLFDTLAEAAAFVRERQGAGMRSIDVGCFQINLMHHPDAFATLEQAFDPAANAAYAASYLAALRQASGGWETAIAWYHSATPGLGEPYRDQVLARWHGGGPPPPALDGGTGAMRAPPLAVRVWTPLGMQAAWPAAPAAIGVVRMPGQPWRFGRLPRVVTAPP